MDQLLAGKKRQYNLATHATQIDVDANDLLNWQVKVETLLIHACGPDSNHLTAFRMAAMPAEFTPNSTRLERMRAVFLAAQEDFEGGYLASVRTLVEAEVFTMQLQQASRLLADGSRSAAAIVAGSVLETALEELSRRQRLKHDSFEQMNAALAKEGTYNLLQQNRLSALAQIRDSAARGDTSQLTDQDVQSMIAETNRFLAEYLR